MSKYPVLDTILACVASGVHKNPANEWGMCLACGEHGDGPTNTWTCGDCNETVYRFRGDYDVTCDCGAQYNASGQRLRDNWRGNMSNYDDDISDLDGYEAQMIREEW